MTRRTCALLAAVTAATGSNFAFGVTQWSFEDGTTQQWQDSFNTPWTNKVVSPFGATDGNLAYSFKAPPGFTFGGEANTRPAGGDITPVEAARWDAFVASNLLLADISIAGTDAPVGTPGDTLRAQYVAMWPAFNGRGPASGLPSLDGNGQKTYTFIGSYDRPVDPESGASAQYQLAFSPGYYAGVKTHTLAWD